MMASQEMIDRLVAAGDVVISLIRGVGESYLDADEQKSVRDLMFGRDLALAVFVAAAGDGSVNRCWLVEGFAQALGEAIAQQPAQNQQTIRDALMRGLSTGEALGARLFRTAGRA